MASLNKVILIGNLGKDPEIRATPSGQSVTTFSLATSEKYKNKNGEKTEHTEWHNIVLWGKLAEIAAEFLSKGRTVYIEGHLTTRKWQGKDGHDRSTTEIIAETMKMLGSKGDKGNNARNAESFSTPADMPDFIDDDDYPF